MHEAAVAPSTGTQVSGGSVPTLLARYGLAPHRDRGQNFLVEPAVANRLVELSGVGAEETAIEVGAGFGMLTRALAARARQVVAIEVDSGLVRALRAEGLPPNVVLEHGDAREVDFGARAEAIPGSVRLVANLPYSVATPLLRNLLDARRALAGWSVMVQKEVAARLNAPTGEADYGSLSILHSLLVTVRRGLDLRPGCFFPAPAVSSSFVCFEPRVDVDISDSELSHLERLLRGAFRQRRKTVWNALRGAGFPQNGVRAALAAVGLEERLRPQQIPPEAWLEFSRRPEIGIAGRSAEKHDREKGRA